jgi:hypothetical protein
MAPNVCDGTYQIVLEAVLDERRGVVEGFVRFGQQTAEVLVDVRGSGNHVQAHVDLLLGRSGDQPQRVVEQHLGRADLDQQRRQAFQVREDEVDPRTDRVETQG